MPEWKEFNWWTHLIVESVQGPDEDANRYYGLWIKSPDIASGGLPSGAFFENHDHKPAAEEDDELSLWWWGPQFGSRNADRPPWFLELGKLYVSGELEGDGLRVTHLEQETSALVVPGDMIMILPKFRSYPGSSDIQRGRSGDIGVLLRMLLEVNGVPVWIPDS